MKNPTLLCLSLFLALSLVVNTIDAQQSPAAPSKRTSPVSQQQEGAPANDDDDTIRITTNLVQVDAIVTDGQGQQVSDLRPEDFKIYEDGREQKITNFSYISTEGPARETSPQAVERAPKDKRGSAMIPVAPARLKPEQVRRTVALVVDNLRMSFENLQYARKALKNYVETQIQPGDLVAIIGTRGGAGFLQQFTSDKNLLKAAIEALRFNPKGGGGLSPFEDVNQAFKQPTKGSELDSGVKEERRGVEETDYYSRDMFAAGTISALRPIVKGLKPLPGRKAIVFFSEGFRLQSAEDRVLRYVRYLGDLANRASVVIHTVDVRGLVADYSAADGATTIFTGLRDQQANPYRARRDELVYNQEGLIFLSEQTGGLAIRNSNDIAGSIRRVFKEQSGYYLIGYRPDDATFNPGKGREKFHKLKIVLNRAGLKVRTRNGFYGFADAERPPQPVTREEQLMAALTSPFTAAQIDLRLTSLFNNEAATGSYMRSLLHLDARSLTFTEESGGSRKAVVDVLAVTMGAGGRILDQVNLTETIEVRADAFQRLLKEGIDYMLNVPVRHAGAYQLRVALRDVPSQRVGSANQFIEVPDINNNRLTLSGVVTSGNDSLSSPAIRRFRSGAVMNFGYVIYNAQVDKATGRPQLQTQMRLFHNGKEIFAGRVQVFDASNQTDLKRLTAGGRVELGSDMTPGEYILQVIVTDPLAKEKYRTATQWVDFEIIR